MTVREPTTLASVVMTALADEHGWTCDRILDTTATKVYDHAAGATQATLRLTRDRETGQFWLRGEYWSEGRNALATCHAVLDPIAAQDQVLAGVNAFVEQVEDMIDETYAMRLSRPRMC